MNTALAMLPTKTDTALWTQPRLTETCHHDGPTAAFNIHLESSFGVGSQWQLKWTVNQLFTWLTNFIAMGPRPHSTSSWKLSYGHSRNSAVHHMMVNLPMLFKITPGGIEGATRGPEMAACFGFWGFWSQNYMFNVPCRTSRVMIVFKWNKLQNNSPKTMHCFEKVHIPSKMMHQHLRSSKQSGPQIMRSVIERSIIKKIVLRSRAQQTSEDCSKFINH